MILLEYVRGNIVDIINIKLLHLLDFGYETKTNRNEFCFLLRRNKNVNILLTEIYENILQ